MRRKKRAMSDPPVIRAWPLCGCCCHDRMYRVKMYVKPTNENESSFGSFFCGVFEPGEDIDMGHYVVQPGDEAQKPTAEEAARDALTTLRGLAEDAADRMKEILDSAAIPDGMKIAVINMVLERVYGRPEEMLRIESGERDVAEAEARLRRVSAGFRM